MTHTLITPSDVAIGYFTRECQICHIVGRVLRNVYDPAPDEAFQTEEANQLEATMTVFIPFLSENGEGYGKILYSVCYLQQVRYMPSAFAPWMLTQ